MTLILIIKNEREFADESPTDQSQLQTKQSNLTSLI